MAAADAMSPAGLAALSQRLTDTIAHVEHQRSALEEVIMRLAEQATQLNAVSGVLTTATHEQGAVLQELQQILQSGGAPAQLSDKLRPAEDGLAQASTMLGAGSGAAAAGATRAPQPEPATPGFAANFDGGPSSFGNDAASSSAAAPQGRNRSSTMGAAYGRPPAPQVIEPDMEDEGGIQYVKDLKVKCSPAPEVGDTLTAEAEFVGTPSVQWYRVEKGTPRMIGDATGLTYTTTADDIMCQLKVECIGPFGGDPVVAQSPVIGLDMSFNMELTQLKKGKEKDIQVSCNGEPRSLAIGKDKLKVKKKRSTERKHEYVKGLAVHLATYDGETFTIQFDAAGAETMELTAQSRIERDLIAYLLRGLVGTNTFASAAAGTAVGGVSRQSGDDGVSVASTERSEGGDGDGEGLDTVNEEGEFMDHLKKGGRGFGEGFGEEGEEGEEGDEDAFRPAIVVKIKDAEEASKTAPTPKELRSAALSFSAPPPPGSGRRRGQSMAATPTSATQGNSAVDDIRRAQQLHAEKEEEAVDATPSAANSRNRAKTMPPTPQTASAPAASTAAPAAATPAPKSLGEHGRKQSLDHIIGEASCRSSGTSDAPPGAFASPGPGAASPGGTPAPFNLLAVESISAVFDGANLREGSFEAKGELRLTQLSHATEQHAFQLRLESASNVDSSSLQPNKSVCRMVDAPQGQATPNGKPPLQFAVRVPARPNDAAKPLALLRYASASSFAPIPLRVVPRWAFADGIDRIELRVTAHPSLKAGLSNVSISVTMPADVSACKAQPAGEWDAAKRTLVWKIEQLPPSQQMPFKADFKTSGPKAGRTGQPLAVSFKSEACTLTGVAPRVAPQGKLGQVSKRFVSGKYVIQCS